MCCNAESSESLVHTYYARAGDQQLEKFAHPQPQRTEPSSPRYTIINGGAALAPPKTRRLRLDDVRDGPASAAAPPASPRHIVEHTTAPTVGQTAAAGRPRLRPRPLPRRRPRDSPWTSTAATTSRGGLGKTCKATEACN